MMKLNCQHLIFTAIGAFGILIASSTASGMPAFSQFLIAQSGNSTSVDKIECAKNARSQGFNPELAVKLCRRATEYTIECAKNARSEGFTPELAVNLCRRARPDTSECAKNARREGFTLEGAVDLCRSSHWEDCPEY